ncbi:ficolin-2 isoform X2 [Musca domestica]|uniref:Ficolin-2 isoform X2 n=1 Tax=Musca domestica TaxID=7370 RepID=A0ABM3ULN1_MUSDO|nr:ficolin-2 isoform X2 [Musca domestica]
MYSPRMKAIFIICVLKVLVNTNDAVDDKITLDNATTEEYYNPYEDEHRLILWKNLFIKVNTLLAETDKLNNKMLNLDKKQQQMEKNMNKLEMDLANSKSSTDLIKNYMHEINTWTTILRRMDGSVDFYRGWTDYEEGFGNPPDGEFFIGLERLHQLTTAAPVVKLKIILKTWDDEERYALYDDFRIGNATEKYKIKALGEYSGNAGDKLRYHVGQNFSTFDADNDNADGNCAEEWKGGWWYKKCLVSNLTGRYKQKEHANSSGILWNNLEWKGNYYSFKYAEMMIRPKVNN